MNGKPIGGSSSGGSSSGGSSSGGSSSGDSSSGDSSGDSSGAAAAGTQPAWCKDFQYSDYTSNDAGWFDGMSMDQIADNGNSAKLFGEAVCATRWDKPAEREKLLALRTKWMAHVGYDEKDFVVAAGEAKGYSEERQELKTLGGAAAQIQDGYASAVLAGIDELGGKASMLVRFHAADRCFEASLGGNRYEKMPILLAVLCTRDTLDRNKALAEIEQLKGINAKTRRDLRRMVNQAGRVAARATTWVSAKAKEDPGVAQLVAIADAQFKEWASPSANRKSLVANLEALEAATRANKHSAFAGCESKTREAWESVLNSLDLPKVPTKYVLTTFVGATLGTAEGYLAFKAMRLCSASMEENFYKGGEILGSDVIRRGPRTATLAAWLAASSEIKFDDRSLKMSDLLRGGSYNDGLGLVEGQRYQNISKGIIDKVTEKDGYVEISFKKVTEMVEDCVKWKQTNRIESISAGGAVNYQYVCKGWGKVKTDLTAKPIKTGKVMAQGLKPGMYLMAIEESMPIVATSGSGSSKAIWVLGGRVK